jgi:hypothetical protein
MTVTVGALSAPPITPLNMGVVTPAATPVKAVSARLLVSLGTGATQVATRWIAGGVA